MTAITSNWIAPANARLPDFIICGAMKSGTTTLHHMLNQHPDVLIPDNETHFFDMDNLLQHPDFNYFDGKKWIAQCMDDDPQKYWQWYSAQFADARSDQIIGEDSTTYLASEISAQRIAMQPKPIKLIIILRHPTQRAYSQYWHMLRTGRATHNFEDTIRYHPHSVLERSRYKEQLRAMFLHIPRERIKIVVFEEFLSDTVGSLQSICEFIGVEPKLLPQTAHTIHTNPALIPRRPALELKKNRWLRSAGNLHYAAKLPQTPNAAQVRKRMAFALFNKAYRQINPLVESAPLPIHAATQRLLDDFFKRELAGINELTGQDVMSIWFAN